MRSATDSAQFVTDNNRLAPDFEHDLTKATNSSTLSISKPKLTQ